MRRLFFFGLCLLYAVGAISQAVNPQPNYVTTMEQAAPSLWLNFNDPTTSFLDQISGLSFTGTTTPTSFVLGPTGTPTANNGTDLSFLPIPSPAGNVASITVKFDGAPTSGAVCTFAVANQSTTTSTSLTVASSFTITLSSTATTQTFVSGTNYTPFSMTQGQLLGMLGVSGCEPGQITSGTGSTLYRYQYGTSTIPSGAETYNHYLNPPSFSAIITTTPGSVVPRQPGFDSTQINNTSAEFPWAGYNAAPNNTLGAIEWDVPWTMMVHVDRLNWSRTGYLILASKGDLGPCVGISNICPSSSSWWQLWLQVSGGSSQLCFERNGYGASGNAQDGVCAYVDAMPNGFNYNILVTDTGTGTPSSLSLTVNGLSGTYLPQNQFSNSYSNGFGFTTLTVAAVGTGFTATTAFTSTGGGTNCTVTGTVAEAGGALTSITISNNYGCTSNPTIVLTAPTGTGGSITAVANTTSMNSTTLPLMVPGYVSGGAYYGIAGTASTQTPTYVDEFAEFGVLSQTAMQSIFYQTKFYQGLLSPVPTPTPVVIWDGAGGGDADGWWGLAQVIKLHQLGIIHLEGVVVEDESVTCEAIQRQMLDSAGLNNVPVSVPSVFHVASGTWCTTAMVTTYNASTPLSNAAWESAVTMERKIFANNPSSPVFILMDSAYTGTAEFMASPADGISSLTGLQLVAQNAANGGAIYTSASIGCTATGTAVTPCTGSTTGDNSLTDAASGQYVFANNGAMPIYLVGGTPANTGPGPTYTRTSTDPFYLLLAPLALTRQGWGSLVGADLVSNYFMGGVWPAYSGGTGYAASTPFTSTGGGPNCHVTGILTASGGVPNGIEFSWGYPFTPSGAYEGLGYGCTSAPALNLVGAIGTGVTLTASPTTFCSTVSIADPSVWTMSITSATCSNHYSVSPTVASLPPGSYASGAFPWFVNSLVNAPPVGQPRVQ